MRLNLARYFFVIVTIFFFIIPFFWLKPGEIDAGGDGSRLYFYDPRSYLENIGLFSVDSQGVGNIVSNQHFIPLLTSMQKLYEIYYSPHLAVTIEKSLKLSLSFLFIYLIVKSLLPPEFYKKLGASEASAILAGIFYTLSPSMSDNMKNALPTHNLMFLNPMIFYLLFRYCITRNNLYIWITLATSLLFATNFSLETPAPFSFYPLAIPFIFIYVRKVLHKAIPWKMLAFAAVMGVGLHAFHIIPVLDNVTNSSSYLHSRILESGESVNPGLAYFDAVRPAAKISNFLLLPRENKLLMILSLIPLVIMFSSLFVSKTNKTLLFIVTFFLITLYLMAANITGVGVWVYRLLFSVPGFGMFRNFSGQWQFVYTFFYALVFGVSSVLFFSRLRKTYAILLYGTLLFYLIARSWPFINGQIINFSYDFSEGVHATIAMDPRYERTLSYIRSLPQDGKILTLPLTDFYMQVFHGTNNGAYIGLSSISYLAGKNDFAGYQILYPFPEVFMKLAREKKYADITSLLSLLNIRYIFHNDDPRIYDTTFPGFPYSYMRQSFPDTQAGYADFVSNLYAHKIYGNGPYKIYETDARNYNPLLYIPDTVSIFKNDRNDWYGENKTFFIGKSGGSKNVVYIDDKSCEKFDLAQCNTTGSYTHGESPDISYSKVNSSKYRVTIKNIKSPFYLVFSNAFNESWKLYLTSSDENSSRVLPFLSNIAEPLFKKMFSDPHVLETLGRQTVADGRHVMANGYANAWLISPEMLAGQSNAQLIIEAKAQQVFYISAIISIVFVGLFLIWILFGIMRRRNDLYAVIKKVQEE